MTFIKSFHKLILSKKFNGVIHFKQFSSTNCLMAQNKIKVGDIKINYEKVGNGPIPLLLLPGALGFIHDFEPQVKNLNRDKFTIVAWDPPGYGKSRPPDRNFSSSSPNSQGIDFFNEDAKYARNLMKELGFNKFSLLGWSDGGITSLVISKLYPDSIDKLVIWGANSFVNQHDMDSYEKVKNIDNWSQRMKSPMIDMYGEAYFRQKWEEWTEAFVNIYKNHSGIILRQEDVNQINKETLIIHGMKDAMVGIEHANFLHENIKNSKLHLMPEGKHNLHLKFASEFNEIVEKFLSKNE